jgi:hypothetical protein
MSFRTYQPTKRTRKQQHGFRARELHFKRHITQHGT